MDEASEVFLRLSFRGDLLSVGIMMLIDRLLFNFSYCSRMGFHVY